MSATFESLLSGLGGGAVIASLALGLVLTYRTSGVVNFAHAAIGAYIAFAYFEFRETGDLVTPVLGLPARVHLVPRPTLATALVVAIVLAAALGALVYVLVVRPLRHQPPLARVVASLGLMLYLQEVVRLRFPIGGAGAVRRRPVLPTAPIRIGATTVSENRLLLAAFAVVVTAALALVFTRTRFGLATRAAADNERGAVLIGLSPDRLGVVNWMVASVLAGLAVIVIEPINGLDASLTPLLVVPAVAAALAGRLSSFAVTTAAGLAIGMTQSAILGWTTRAGSGSLPHWLPTTGVQQAVPLVAIIAILTVRGDALPDRAAIVAHRLPASPTPRFVPLWAVAAIGTVAATLSVADASLRHGLIVSLIAIVLSLSVVVATGFSGQISLAPTALAGVAGFSAVRLGTAGVPFLVVLVLAVAVATAVGVALMWPATRVRGMTLAVATLAIAVALEQIVLASPAMSGGAAGSATPRLELLGWNLGVDATGADNFRPQFVALCLALTVIAAVSVASLRRSRVGLRWLAVRSNERAAAAAGINVTAAKLGAVAVSSALAGLAGVLTAYSVTRLSPTSFMVAGALATVALTYLAGVSSISGAVLAGIIAPAGLLTVLGGAEGERTSMAVSGIALIAAAIFAPAGLTGLGRSAWHRLRSPRTSRTAHTAAEPEALA